MGLQGFPSGRGSVFHASYSDNALVPAKTDDLDFSTYVGVVGRLKLIDEKLISACLRCAGMDRQVQSSMVQWSEDTVVPGPAYPQPALRPGDQTKNTTALWKLAGEENNLSYLIPLLKKYKEHVPEKHYIVSLLLSRSILRYYGMAPYAVLHLDWTNIITMCLFIR